MTNILGVVNGIFSSTIRSLYPEFTQLKQMLQHSHSGSTPGDYTCMAAMPIAKVFHLLVGY